MHVNETFFWIMEEDWKLNYIFSKKAKLIMKAMSHVMLCLCRLYLKSQGTETKKMKQNYIIAKVPF